MSDRRFPIVIQRILKSSRVRRATSHPSWRFGVTGEDIPMTIDHKRAGWGFCFQWVAASTVGFALGATAIGALGRMISDKTPTFVAAAVFPITVVVVAALPGFLHWLILRRWFPRAGWWVAASGVGSLLACAVTAWGLSVADTQGETTFARFAVPASMAIAGAVVGAAQWVVLRWWVTHAGWWVLASSITWVAAASAYLSLTRGNDVNLALGGAASGALSGAVTGLVLVALIRMGHERAPSAPGAGVIA
jgi:hypothetical protein